tara:strand:- start:1652 stop:2395 length:744 start_codon:yes stop_codon:yes gene_type:complete
MSKKQQDKWSKSKNKIKKHNQILKPYQSTIDFEKFLKNNNLITKKTKHIVDIGTGIGSHLNYLSKKNYKLKFTGIDYSNSLIKCAKKLNNNPNIDFSVVDIMKKNKKRNLVNCDGVICIQTFCCFKNSEDPIKFMVSLKPKWIAINSLFYDGPLDVFIHIKDYEDLNTDKGGDGDFNIFSIQNISKKFKRYGYRLIKSDPYFPKKKIIRLKNKGRGSYTIKNKSNKNITFSGPVHLPWHFLIAKKIA